MRKVSNQDFLDSVFSRNLKQISSLILFDKFIFIMMNCLAKFYWLAELLSKFVQFSIFFIYGLRYNHTTVALSLTKQC